MIKVIICQKVLPYNIQTQIKPKIQTKNKLGWVGKPAKTQLNQNPGRLGWVWSGFGFGWVLVLVWALVWFGFGLVWVWVWVGFGFESGLGWV